MKKIKNNNLQDSFSLTSELREGFDLCCQMFLQTQIFKYLWEFYPTIGVVSRRLEASWVLEWICENLEKQGVTMIVICIGLKNIIFPNKEKKQDRVT